MTAQTDSRVTRLEVSMLIGYFVVAIAVAGAAVLIVPTSERSAYFWPRLAWTEFLMFLTWSFHGGLAYVAGSRADASSRLMGIVPGVGIIVTAYALVSFGLMVAASHFDGDRLSNYHLAAQVVVAAVAVLTCITMYASAEVAAEGAEPLPSDLPGPSDLALMLERQEAVLRSSDYFKAQSARALVDSLKSLREQVRYGLPEVGPIGSSDQYRAFAQSIEGLCREVEKLPSTEQQAREALGTRLREAATSLKAGLPFIQQSLKRA